LYNAETDAFSTNEIEVIAPSAFPFAARNIVLRNSYSLSTVTLPLQAFYNTDDINAYVDYLNTVIVPRRSLNGTFAVLSSGGNYGVGYINGIGENWTILEAGDIFTTYVSMMWDGAVISFSGSLPSSNSLILDDGSVPYPYSLTVSDNTTPIWNASVTSTISTTRRIHLFYMGSFESFVISTYDNPSTGGWPTGSADEGFSGQFPAGITFLSITPIIPDFISPGFMAGACNIRDVMGDCIPTLQILYITQQNVGSFSPDLFTNHTDFDDNAFNALQQWDVSGNNLNSSQVDTLFNVFHSEDEYVSGGNANTMSQISYPTHAPAPAPPTAASLGARDALMDAGWSISTD
jgi:hypothetical protein